MPKSTESVDPFAAGTFVPLFDWLSALELTRAERHLYGLLASYRGKGERQMCCPKISDLATRMGAHPRDVRRHLARLVELGTIAIDNEPNKHGRPSHYTFLKHPLMVMGVSPRGENDPPGEKTPEPQGDFSADPGGEKTPGKVDPGVETQRVKAQPAVASQVNDLEARYAPAIVAAARDACALSRKNGVMQDSVWLKLLKQLVAFPVDACEHGMALMAERHADGSKSEAYMLAIIRRVSADERPIQLSLQGRSQARPWNQRGHKSGSFTPDPTQPHDTNTEGGFNVPVPLTVGRTA